MSASRHKGHLFLLEIRTEEMPANAVSPALEDLRRGLFQEIAVGGRLAPQAAFGIENLSVFGTPRRLAAQATGLLGRQPDEMTEVIGPQARMAYDASGKPTRAAEGFARAQGVPLGELRTVPTPRGPCVAVRKELPGRSAAEILAEAVPRVLAAMTFPKMMRWAGGEHRFVRPVHSIVALFDSEVVDLTFAGVRSGRETVGRRFVGTGRVAIPDATGYVEILRRSGVLADVAERRKAIDAALQSAAQSVGGRIAPPPGGGEGDPELLEEVTQMIEWPTVITGQFDATFLGLPSEILVTTMRHHQKYFSLLDGSGKLLNRFLAVANIDADRSGAIRRGNEWVLRARLADARFFWDEDRKRSLTERTPLLERVTFHEKLGSYALKTARLVRLLETIATAFEEAGLSIDRDAAVRAAALSKCDLTTQMVREVPELQGIVGGLYAAAEGMPENLAGAIYEHYRPGGARDPIPHGAEGAALSLADRIDTQVGIFLLGVVPTGSRDPYGMRRSTQGVCRILIEQRIGLSLSRAIDNALGGYSDQSIQGAVGPQEVRASLLEFYRGRLQHLGEEAGLRQDSVRAVLAASADDPYDARSRMDALDVYRRDPRFEALVLAHKRIANILRGQPACRLDPRGLRERSEKDLLTALEAASPRLDEAATHHDQAVVLKEITSLAEPLDRFFTEVMVMVEDRPLRENRLGLLQRIAALFLRVADFSEVVTEGEPAAAGRGR